MFFKKNKVSLFRLRDVLNQLKNMPDASNSIDINKVCTLWTILLGFLSHLQTTHVCDN